jgi:flagellin FlaB
MLNTDNRGQVGIGTLIVFIAMVLVAAIAAGVLINTAGLLQAQAQQTGQETTAEVSDVIEVGKIVGYENASDIGTPSLGGNGKIEAINASFRLAAGSDAINLSKASYTLSSGSNATVISGNNRTNGDVISYYPIQGFQRETSILADVEDLMVVRFNLTNASGVNSLSQSDKLKLVVQAPAGGSTYKQVEAPRRIKEGSSYIL